MNIFYLTFKRQCSKDTHPFGGDRSGWMEVMAEDIESATTIVMDLMGTNWGFLHDKTTFMPELYPDGCLKKINF